MNYNWTRPLCQDVKKDIFRGGTRCTNFEKTLVQSAKDAVNKYCLCCRLYIYMR